MPSIEEFLRELPQPIQIVGGSPLCKWRDLVGESTVPANAISINGLVTGAGVYAAAINCGRGDERRTQNWKRVMRPTWPHGAEGPARIMVPSIPLENYLRRPVGRGVAFEFRAGKQPTTCFALLVICDRLELPVDLWGVCGWASKFHDGDLEMHYIKNFMPLVTVHDPRPKW